MQLSNIDWSDVRYFLETVRSGSARATAQKLNISHSTVSRRIESLESSLNTRLFNRDVSGYKLTNEGETLVGFAEQAEHSLIQAEQLLKGKDGMLRGEIRLTTADAIANHLLMDEIASFTRSYPEIDVEVVLSSQVIDLNEHTVDLALRILPNDIMPPEPLIGRMVAKIATLYYASPDYLQEYDPWAANTQAKLIGWGELGRYPDWVRDSPLAHLSTVCRLNHSAMQVEAAIAGVGIARLPCFIGDRTPGLTRVSGIEVEVKNDLWMLSHPDKRDVARLRAFKEVLVAMFERKKDLMLGR